MKVLAWAIVFSAIIFVDALFMIKLGPGYKGQETVTTLGSVSLVVLILLTIFGK